MLGKRGLYRRTESSEDRACLELIGNSLKALKVAKIREPGCNLTVVGFISPYRPGGHGSLVHTITTDDPPGIEAY